MSDDLIELRIHYPSGAYFTLDNGDLFYDKHGAKKPQVVKVFLKRWCGERAARNDSGAFILASTLQSSRRGFAVARNETEFASNGIDAVVYRRGERQQYAALNSDDGRVLIARCAWESVCETSTTWAGEIAVSIQYDKKYYPLHIIKIDSFVNKLISTISSK